MEKKRQAEFEKFRHEIYKLGLTGLEKKDQIDARVELAIKLGAKPKKWIKPVHKLGEESKLAAAVAAASKSNASSNINIDSSISSSNKHKRKQLKRKSKNGTNRKAGQHT